MATYMILDTPSKLYVDTLSGVLVAVNRFISTTTCLTTSTLATTYAQPFSLPTLYSSGSIQMPLKIKL